MYTTELRVRAWRRKCVLIHQDEVLLEGCVWQLPAAVLTHQFDRIAATLSASAASSVQQGGRHVSSWELGAVPHFWPLCSWFPKSWSPSHIVRLIHWSFQIWSYELWVMSYFIVVQDSQVENCGLYSPMLWSHDPGQRHFAVYVSLKNQAQKASWPS